MTPKLRSSHVPGELLIRLKNPGAGSSRLSASPLKSEGEILARYPLGGQASLNEGFSDSEIIHLRLSDQSSESLEAAIARLHADPNVAYAVTNDFLHSFSDQSEPPKNPPSDQPRVVRPNDLAQGLYGMESIRAPQGWADSTGSRGSAPLIAVIDSGTDYTHSDLAANIWRNPGEQPNGLDDDGNGVVDDIHGYNAALKTGDPQDSGSHGTHVAGTVAAVGNNGLGVTGVAWEAQLMPVSFIAGGMGTMADAIAAIAYADAMGARITQNSWGGVNPNQALVDALEASPALHICAAGNSANNSDIKPMYPAAYDLENIVSVAATDGRDHLTSFSNFGEVSVDLAAPGLDILSTLPGQAYGTKSGTSMATPHVSGAASLILNKFPGLTNGQLKDRLLFSVDRLPHLEGKLSTGGRLNLAKALENDPVNPGAIQELKADQLEPEGLTLQWQASGDDGRSGRAAAYEVAFSMGAINEENFSDLAQVKTPVPKSSGRGENLRVDLVPSATERQINFGVRTVDNVGNRSELQTLAVTVPAAQVAFEDKLENWTTEGDWGHELVKGRGLVWSDSPGGNYRRDQNASLTGKVFSLKGFESAKLQFDCRHDLEINFDKVFLEMKSDREGDWEELKAFNLVDGWHREEFDLQRALGKEEVQLRFRLKTDGDVFQDGFSFNNLVVTGTRVAES